MKVISGEQLEDRDIEVARWLADELWEEHFGSCSISERRFGSYYDRRSGIGWLTWIAEEYNNGVYISAPIPENLANSMLGGKRYPTVNHLRVVPVYGYGPLKLPAVTFLQIDIDYPDNEFLRYVKERCRNGVGIEEFLPDIDASEDRQHDIRLLRDLGFIAFDGCTTGVNGIAYFDNFEDTQKARECVVRLRNALEGTIDCTSVGNAPEGNVATPLDFYVYPTVMPFPTEYPHRKQNQLTLPEWFRGVRSLDDIRVSIDSILNKLPSTSYDLSVIDHSTALHNPDHIETIDTVEFGRQLVKGSYDGTPVADASMKGHIHRRHYDPNAKDIGVIARHTFNKWLTKGNAFFATEEQVRVASIDYDEFVIANRLRRYRIAKRDYTPSTSQSYFAEFVLKFEAKRSHIDAMIDRIIKQSSMRDSIKTRSVLLISIYLIGYMAMRKGKQFALSHSLWSIYTGVACPKAGKRYIDSLVDAGVIQRDGMVFVEGTTQKVNAFVISDDIASIFEIGIEEDRDGSQSGLQAEQARSLQSRDMGLSAGQVCRCGEESLREPDYQEGRRGVAGFNPKPRDEQHRCVLLLADDDPTLPRLDHGSTVRGGVALHQ